LLRDKEIHAITGIIGALKPHQGWRRLLQNDQTLLAALLLIDDNLTFIGSANLDPRSLHLNTEMGVLVDSRELNRLVRRNIAADFSKRNARHLQAVTGERIIWVGDDVTLDEQPAESRLQRLEDWFFGLLPIANEM
jgi:cardiolipin synthase C